MATQLDLVLDMTDNGLGCTVSGGSDTPDYEQFQGLEVASITEGGAASRCGLRAGDVIVAVDTVNIRPLTHNEAIGILKQHMGKQVNIRVERRQPADVSLTIPNPVYPGNDEVAVTSDGSEAAGAVSTADSTRIVAAQKAFASRDPEMSRIAHQTIPAEKHQKLGGSYLKAAVFGGLDGIITTFAVVASVVGADFDTSVIIIMGFANLFADGISMGFGEYLSGSAELEYAHQERSRELWEFENFPEGELEEMIDLYKEHGFSSDEARSVLNVMAKHKDFFIDHMMVQELGVMPPDEDDSPFKQGCVMFCSFLCFGIIPLLSYLIFDSLGWSSSTLFIIACVLTGLALFALGAFKSKFTSQTWWRSGTWVFLNGATAAAVAYLIGYGLEQIVDVTCA